MTSSISAYFAWDNLSQGRLPRRQKYKRMWIIAGKYINRNNISRARKFILKQKYVKTFFGAIVKK